MNDHMSVEDSSIAKFSASSEDMTKEEIEEVDVAAENESNGPADFDILCRGGTAKIVRYKMHRHVLVQGSKYFEKLFATFPSSGENVEAQENVLELEEDSIVVFALLRSLYSDAAALNEALDVENLCDSHDEDCYKDRNFNSLTE